MGRHHQVKQHVGMSIPRHHTQVVNAQPFVISLELFRYVCPQFSHLAVAGHDGIVMNHHLQALFLPEIPLYIVDQVVSLQRVHLRREFNMQGSELVPRAVIVNQQIMHAQDVGITQYRLFYPFHQFRVRTPAQQGIQ